MSYGGGRRIAAAMAAAALCLGLASCGTTGASGGDSQARFVSGNGNVTLVPVDQRKPAPAATGELITGQPWSLAADKGKVVALNVWASWCAPCRAEAPTLQKLNEDLSGHGVVMTGLVTRDSKASAEAFIRRFGLTYPNVWDPTGSVQLLFSGDLPPAAIPSTLLVDRQGRVAGRIIGAVDRAELRKILTELAAEKS